MKQIYFDSDEEITAIISKLESIESNRIALIPPKRSTTLQSVVNLKLIQKAVTANDNELVVVTKDPFILNIASQLKILTAPNLESEPEVPQPQDSRQAMPSAVIEGSEATEKDYTSADEAAAGVEAGEETEPKTPGKSSGKKTNQNVPDFERFKKYLLIGIVLLLLLAVFLWWALFLAPKATIRIQGVTREVSAEEDITLDPKAETSEADERRLAATPHQEGRTLSKTFQPSGTTTVGDKASGEVTITNDCYETESTTTVEKGTAITSQGGYVFVNDVAFDIAPASVDQGSCQSSQVTVSVTADQIGSQYNIDPTSFTVEGFPSGSNGINGQSEEQMTGGSSEEVPTVTESDIQTARQQLLNQERETVKKTLRNQFDDSHYIVDASFRKNITKATSEPAPGEEVEGKARLILQVTYTLLGVQQSDLEALLAHIYRQQVEKGQELGVIDNGLEDVQLQRNQEARGSYFVRASGVLGPDISTDELKNQIAGKSYSQTIEFIEAKPNVTTAKVNLSPLWVGSVPQDHGKIEIIFEVADPDGDDTGN
ncbi:hypothetical protein BRC20_00600 [Candidatus Saccharibacteria bacterium QS_8_54_8]|nr:MAG: hypothetical protein BRC20_00600 [Candidatus Saccharibacteria bacterium QS_8_54_8]